VAGVGAHVVLQDLEKGRPLEIDALLTVVQEMRRLVDVETPTIDTVLAWVQQMGREVKSVPPFPRFRWAKTGRRLQWTGLTSPRVGCVSADPCDHIRHRSRWGVSLAPLTPSTQTGSRRSSCSKEAV